jgi:hypothetical protein
VTDIASLKQYSQTLEDRLATRGATELTHRFNLVTLIESPDDDILAVTERP